MPTITVWCTSVERSFYPSGDRPPRGLVKRLLAERGYGGIRIVETAWSTEQQVARTRKEDADKYRLGLKMDTTAIGWATLGFTSVVEHGELRREDGAR